MREVHAAPRAAATVSSVNMYRPVRGLERHAVAHRRAQHLELARLGTNCRALATPRESVEAVEHRAAQIQGRARRRLPSKRTRKAGSYSFASLPMLPGDISSPEPGRRLRAALQRPELAGESRKKQETGRGQRNRHRQRARRQSQRGARGQRAAGMRDRRHRRTGAPRRSVIERERATATARRARPRAAGTARRPTTMPSSRRVRDSASLSAPMSTSNAVPAARPFSVRKLRATASTSSAVTAPSR